MADTTAEPTQSGKLTDRIDFDIEQERIIYPIGFLILFFSTWIGLIEVFNLPIYILPPPHRVFFGLPERLGFFVPHIRVTVIAAGFGWAVGNLIGIGLGLVMAESRMIRVSVYPYLIALRSIPIIALAPLLILWLGINIQPILATATIIVFFPTLVNSITGFTSTDDLTMELMKSLDASKWDIYRHVKIYNAMPYIFSSLKISVALSLIGAIVGEWLVADTGLGYLIVLANNRIQTVLLFRTLFLIGIFGTTWFMLISIIESLVIDWKSTGEAGGTR